MPWLLLLIALGAVVTDRVSRTAAVLTFLATYFAVFSLDAVFFSGAGRLGEVYRPPFLNAALFLAFFMVTDPPTSPARDEDQAWFGGATALASFAVFQVWPTQAFLLAGLLGANAAWAVRAAVRARGLKRPSLEG